MVFRVYVEKRSGLDNEARELYEEITSLLSIDGLKKIRVLNRYDVENISEKLFAQGVKTVFSEPQLDITYDKLPDGYDRVFAVEFLPGQFDQRADSAAQCLEILSRGDKPTVRTAKVYLLTGKLTEEQLAAVKKYVVNPVEAREASLDLPETLNAECEKTEKVAVLKGFCDYDDGKLGKFVAEEGLAMDKDDAAFCRDYFRKEGRDPTVTEIKMIDTYWSDHCRHTTFLTTVDKITFRDPAIQKTYEKYISDKKELRPDKPVNLMDIATLAAKVLKKKGLLKKLDESEEINACTVKIEIDVDGEKQPWLLLFKNETHNHPTEIEPFGGAATCIGGAIRDPLSGRSYVYAAMRVTGAGDPTVPVSETIEGKLPQVKLVRTAAAGYSSYGNQIGLATGIVDELYHPGYVAKRMEIGAVIAAAPQENVRRERPKKGDVVILLGGRTGRDGIGGATGSSKAHNLKSVEKSGAEVQKGNAPEERKLQRLFRRADACKMIKRCNDFGAGGVSVAIGELADGLDIDLGRVPKKYEGLNGTELAISESQERMAVVVAEEDAEKFIRIANEENTEATIVAVVTDDERLKMRWNGDVIVDISREFLNSNGAEKHIEIEVGKPENYDKKIPSDFRSGVLALSSDLNVCSKRGLSERFDSTIGAGTVLMPFGGKYQRTPIQAMVHKISVEKKHTDDCSFMSWGFNPFISEKSPYHGAYLAVVESLSKLAATGADFNDTYLTFQEYFEKPGKNPTRWGKPAAALLGAYKAQLDYGVAAIGGKDSMSGSFEKMDVPPTLVSFAVTTGKTQDVISDEFKKAGRYAVLLLPEYADGLPTAESVKRCAEKLKTLTVSGKAFSAYTPTYGGVAEAVIKMCLGNGFGFCFDENISLSDLFSYRYGAFVVETDDPAAGIILGRITEDGFFRFGSEKVSCEEFDAAYEGKLEKVYPCAEKKDNETFAAISHREKEIVAPAIKIVKPKVVIPVFPGTNCEYDTAKALSDAGADAEIFVVRNLTPSDIERSSSAFASMVAKSQMIFVPGGFSGGDEPDGSGKFIKAFFLGEEVKEAVNALVKKRDGLICGICNGFQALIKLGLVPYGEITEINENSPTLTFNTIARHQSKLVRIRVASDKSPWLRLVNVGDVFTVPISHGEGRFMANDETVKKLIANGQIATQYVDEKGEPTSDIRYNPNGSVLAIEGITSPDGRVFGKMGHSERIGTGLYKNVPGEFDMKIFRSAVKYFS
ncbi:MAG: phosphoribosylformylglycinamidine synthase [Clostridia bacterium]|nr:phosphoribosylformylglycinamidine synthase [Clostridia bacterium]